MFVGMALFLFLVEMLALLQYVKTDTGMLVAFIAIFGVGTLLVLVLGVLLVWSGITLLVREGPSIAHSLGLLLGIGVLGYPIVTVALIWAEQQQAAVILLFLGFPLSYLAFVLVSYLIYAWLYGFITRRFYRSFDSVVALGAGLNGMELTPLLRARVDLALKKARSNSSRLVLSGGMGADEQIPEAVAMAAYVRKAGYPEEEIVQEERSTNTLENLRFSQALVPESTKWLAVSSDYHAFRAACLMRVVGMRGGAIGARTPRYFWASAVLREYIALLRQHMWLNAIVLTLSAVPLGMALVAVLFNA